MLSLNGSPIANPYHIWQGNDDGGRGTLRRTKSTITVQRDPSSLVAAGVGSEIHSRTTSQSSQVHQYSSSSSFDGGTAVQPTHPALQHHAQSHHAHTKSQTQFLQFKFPQLSESQATESTRRPLAHTRSQSTLPVTLSTKDGHLLAFDALQTSPGAIDALEGISNSAKKQAREEMRVLVQAAVDKWTI